MAASIHPARESLPLVLRAEMTERSEVTRATNSSAQAKATVWSITINNPVESELRCEVPGWKLEGQFEVGKEGTAHFQGMLKTPQVRFAAVKRVFPRAHIEVARNKEALANYVKKEETRVDVYTPGAVPTIFQYQSDIASKWRNEEWIKIIENVPEEKHDDVAMNYLDILVKRDIEAGQRGAEWIAINPMWRSSWKKFWRSIIKRHHGTSRKQEEGSTSSDSQDAQEGQIDETNEGSGGEDC